VLFWLRLLPGRNSRPPVKIRIGRYISILHCTGGEGDSEAERGGGGVLGCS
jgi:hypothetical protein